MRGCVHGSVDKDFAGIFVRRKEIADTFHSMTLSHMMTFGKMQRRELKNLAFKFFWQYAKEVEKQHKKKYFHTASDMDQMRLLTWKNWMDKHKIPLSYIVKVIVGYWLKKFEHRTRHKKFGVGVSIATLTGHVSENILLSQLAKDFPNEENIIAWKSNLQQQRTLKPVKNVAGEDFVERYVRVMEIRQSKNDYAQSSGRFTRRRYRGNPWI